MEEIVKLGGLLVGFGLLVLVPVIAILTEHQRKMAEILRGPAPEMLEEMRAMRAEIGHLASRVDSLALPEPKAVLGMGPALETISRGGSTEFEDGLPEKFPTPPSHPHPV